jgi:hypothetical protein
LLRQSWDELSDSVFIAAFDYEETPVEEEEQMDPLDEGFHLDMVQESGDKGFGTTTTRGQMGGRR